MAFEIRLYKFNKKPNSTARPDATSYLSYQCTPRHDISILAPVVTVRAESLIGYNYAYIPRYERYYFITDIVNDVRGLWDLSLSCDTLASFKNEILASSEYVARSATSYNGNIQDEMYPAKSGSYISMTSAGTPFVDDLYSGTFIVGVVNGIAGASSTAITYYAMSASDYATLLGSLCNQTTMASILGIVVNDEGIVQGLTGCLQDISYDVYMAQVNPIQYVVSSVYIPIAKSAFPVGGSTQLKLGKFNMGQTVDFLSNVRVEISAGSISLPKHPNYNVRGQYLNAPPYSNYTTHFPGFGTIELDGARVSRWSTIKAKIILDACNGSAYLYLNTNDGDEKPGAVGIMSGNIGISIPVTQMLATDLKGNLIADVAKVVSNVANDSGGLGNSIISRAHSAISKALINAADVYTMGLASETISNLQAAGAITRSPTTPQGSVTGITSGLQSIPTLSMSGSPGGSAALWGEWWIKNEYFILVNEDLETLGRPLMEIKKLDDLRGFCQCLNTHTVTSGTAQENDIVNSYLCNGFFIE
jgi:hypothetical protein